MFRRDMLKDREDEIKFGNSFRLLLAIGFIGKCDGSSIIVNDSSVGYGRVPGVAGDIA